MYMLVKKILKRPMLIGAVVFAAGIIIFDNIGWTMLHYKYQHKLSIANFNESKVVARGSVIEKMAALEGNKIFLKAYNIIAEGKHHDIKYGLIQLDKRYLPQELKHGDFIEVTLYLKRPESKKNPGEFCYYSYLKYKGIYSQGYVNGDVKITGRYDSFLKDILIKIKYRFLELFEKTTYSPDSLSFEYNEVLKALLLGERDNLSPGIENNFSKSGINHLLAISGLHVGFIMMFLLKILKIFPFKQHYKNIFITMFIIIYILITGMRPSVFRAGILVIVYLWAPLFNRKADIYNTLGFTALFNLIINPYQLYMPGFQLTYLVVLMILIWQDILKRIFRKIPAGFLLALSTAALMGASPLTAYYFNIITPISVLSNLWAVPLAALIVILGTSCLFVGLIVPGFFVIINRLLILLISIMDKGANLSTFISFGHFEVGSSMFWSILVIFILLTLPVLLKKNIIPFYEKRRKINLFLYIILILVLSITYVFVRINDKSLKITFLAVGQGDCIHINLPDGQQILIDGGGLLGTELSRGEYTVLPYLKYKGIKVLDIVFISHFDTDHALGVIDILQKRDVKLLVLPYHFEENYLYNEVIKAAGKKGVSVLYTKIGDIFQLGDVKIKVLNPFINSSFSDYNENSIVFTLDYHNFRALFTGDLGCEGEKLIIDKFLNLAENKKMDRLFNINELNCNVLKIGHHGSANSSSNLFLKYTRPEAAVISTGKNNYGHPAEVVLKRLEERDILYMRTDKDGAVFINTDGFKYKIKSYCRQ